MGRDRGARRRVAGWLLGVLVTFFAVLPVTGAAACQQSASPPAGTLARSGSLQHVDALTASQRPEPSQTTLQLAAAVPAEQRQSVSFINGAPPIVQDRPTSRISTSSVTARAPPFPRV